MQIPNVLLSNLLELSRLTLKLECPPYGGYGQLALLGSVISRNGLVFCKPQLGKGVLFCHAFEMACLEQTSRKSLICFRISSSSGLDNDTESRLSLEYPLLHCLADLLILPMFKEHEKELRSYLQAQKQNRRFGSPTRLNFKKGIDRSIFLHFILAVRML